MGLITDVRVHHPTKDELVSDTFHVAGIGAGFEGTIGIRVLSKSGKVLVESHAQSSGGGIGLGEFKASVRVANPPRPGTRVTVQVFGDNPGPGPGFNTREVDVIMFAGTTGWLLYRVESGDTLTGLVSKLRDLTRTTVAQIVAANPKVTDPDLIQVGWRLRIPIRS